MGAIKFNAWMCTAFKYNIYSATNHKSSFTLWFRIKNGNRTKQFGCLVMFSHDSQIGDKFLGVWSFIEGAELKHCKLICDVFIIADRFITAINAGGSFHSTLFLMQHTGELTYIVKPMLHCVMVGGTR